MNTAIDETARRSTEPVISGKRLWGGRIMGGLPALFLLMDGGMKLFKSAFDVEATKQLGCPESSIVGIGLALLASTLLFLVPRTSIFGVILLTGYLGGAVVTHVRIGGPLFNVMFPIIFGSLL